MSKERAHRRAEREREQAIRAAARARAEERSRAKEVRRRALTSWIPRPQLRPGVLAARRRGEVTVTVVALLALNLLLWIVRPDWEARLLGLIVSVLAAPVLHTMLFRRR